MTKRKKFAIAFYPVKRASGLIKQKTAKKIVIQYKKRHKYKAKTPKITISYVWRSVPRLCEQ